MTERDDSIHIVAAHNMSDILDESEHTYLRKRGFIRTHSAEEQWLLMVRDAWNKSGLPANDIINTYISYMLYRFMGRTDLVQCLKSLGQYCYALSIDMVDEQCLQDVADMNLIYVSLFSDVESRRREHRSLGYLTDLGEGMFKTLADMSESKNHCDTEAFKEISNGFGTTVMVLRSVNLPLNAKAIVRDPRLLMSEREAQHAAQQMLLHLKQSRNPTEIQ